MSEPIKLVLKESNYTSSTEGIPITQQQFIWKQTVGELPFIGEVCVPRAIAKEINKLKNPISIYIKVENNHGVSELLIENLYIINFHLVDDFNVFFRIADCRWLFQGKKVLKDFNITLTQNSNTTAMEMRELVSNEPYKLRAPFETITSGRYAPHSLNKKTGKAYTVGEMLIEILRDALKQSPNGLGLLPVINTNTVILDNIQYKNTDLPSVLRELLSIAKIGMSVSLKGYLYIYSMLDSKDIEGNDPVKKLQNDFATLEGRIFQTEKRKARPKSINVLFEKKIETLLVNTEETREWEYTKGYFPTTPLALPELRKSNGSRLFYDNDMCSERKVIGCVNVVPNPYPLQLALNNLINVGEYIPFKQFLTLYGISQSVVNTPGFFGDLLQIKVRNSLLVNSGYIQGALDMPLYILAGRLANVIRTHYQQTFMIDPYYLPQIQEWENNRCSIINTYDGRHAPSLVFCNYTFIPYARSPELLQTVPQFQNESYISNVLEDENLENPSPAEIEIVNKNLGVFRLRYREPVDATVAKIIPHKLNVTPFPAADSANILLSQTYPLDDFLMFALISMVWRTDNSGVVSKKKLYSVVCNSAGKFEAYNDGSSTFIEQPDDCDFDSWDIPSDYDYARYPFRILGTNNPIIDKMTGKQLSKYFRPLNEDFLIVSAKYEAMQIYKTFADRFCGKARLAGLRPDFIPCYNLTSVEYSVGINSESTTLTFVDSIPFPSEVNYFSQRELDYLRNQINRAGTISYGHITD